MARTDRHWVPLSQMTPPRFFQPVTSKLSALLETHLIPSNAKVLLIWLLAQAEPSDGVVRDLTQIGMAERMSWDRKTVSRALTDLYGAGMIALDFPPGSRPGWVHILAYHDVMQPSKWLSRQRAIGNTPVDN